MKFVLSRTSWVWLLLCALSISLYGCGGGGGGAPAPTLTGVKLQPADSSIAAGTRQQFQLVGTYSDGSSQDLTASASWASSNANVATISNTSPTKGLASGLAPGTTQITASGGGQSISTTLKVLDATVQSISVSPTSASIAKGLSYSFKATATLSTGATQDVTTSCSWSSSDTAVATVDASNGVASGTGIGSATISASLSGLKSSAQLAVGEAVVQSLLISPATASAAKGNAQKFTATAQYSDGSSVDATSAATWSSADASIASVDSTGAARALAVGATKISATYGGVSSTADFSVTPAAVVSLAVSPASASVTKGATQQLQAVASYTDGSTQDLTSSAAWTSSDTAVATVSAQGLATAAAVGAATISASASGVTASMQFTALAPTLSSLSLSPQNPIIGTESTQAFTLLAHFSDGSTQDVTQQASWSNSNAYAISLSAQGVATPVSAGSTTVGAQYSGYTLSTAVTVGGATYIPYWLEPTTGTTGALYSLLSDKLTQSPTLVDATVPIALGQIAVPFSDEAGAIQGMQPHTAFYVGGTAGAMHFYRMALDATQPPAPMQISGAVFADSSEICASSVMQMNEAVATQAIILYSSSGDDGACNSADDVSHLIHYSDDKTIPPENVSFPAFALSNYQYAAFVDSSGLVDAFVALDASNTLLWSKNANFSSPVTLLKNIQSIRMLSRDAHSLMLVVKTIDMSPYIPSTTSLYRVADDGSLSAPLFDYGAASARRGFTYQDMYYFTDVQQSCYPCTGQSATLRVMRVARDGSATAQILAVLPEDPSGYSNNQPNGSAGVIGPVNEKLIIYYTTNGSGSSASTLYSLDPAQAQPQVQQIYSVPGFFDAGIGFTPDAIFLGVYGAQGDSSVEVLDAAGTEKLSIADASVDGFHYSFDGTMVPYAKNFSTRYVYVTRNVSLAAVGGSSLQRIDAATLAIEDVLDGMTGQPYQFDTSYFAYRDFSGLGEGIFKGKLFEYNEGNMGGSTDLMLLDETGIKAYRKTGTIGVSEWWLDPIQD